MKRIHWSGFALLIAAGLVCVSASASEPEVRITLYEDPAVVEGWSREAPREASSGGLGFRGAVPPSTAGPSTDGIFTGGNLPTTEEILFPFVVDGGNPAGTTTLFSVTNESELPGPFTTTIGFFDADNNAFHVTAVSLSSGELASFNVRDQPGLPSGFQRGYVSMVSDGDSLNSVDFFVVTPDQDFASGDLAPQLGNTCNRWRTRVLIGGPFTGGTSLLFVVNGPRGPAPGDPPTVFGAAYNEAGTLVNGFDIRTSAWVFQVNAEDLVAPSTLFGYIELTIDSTGGDPSGGFVFTTLGAENRYSVGTIGICRDFVPIP